MVEAALSLALLGGVGGALDDFLRGAAHVRIVMVGEARRLPRQRQRGAEQLRSPSGAMRDRNQVGTAARRRCFRRIALVDLFEHRPEKFRVHAGSGERKIGDGAPHRQGYRRGDSIPPCARVRWPANRLFPICARVVALRRTGQHAGRPEPWFVQRALARAHHDGGARRPDIELHRSLPLMVGTGRSSRSRITASSQYRRIRLRL